MKVDAIVIGAGPAGATAAQRLAKMGWSVALVEKAIFPRRKVCGEFVSAPTLALLDALGVGETFRAEAGPEIRRIGFFAGNATLSADLPGNGDGGRALGRERLDTLLRDAAVAAGAHLLQPAEAIAVHGAPGQLICQVRQNHIATELAARIVIVACGSWSNTGPFVIPDDGGKNHDLLAFKGRFHSASLPEDLMPLLAFPGGYGGLVNSDSGQLSFSCCIRQHVLVRVRHPGERAADAVFRHIQATTRGFEDVFQSSTIADAMLSVGPVRPGWHACYREGVFFTGNIAGEAHPVIADGISMAIQSSWLLTRMLAQAGPDAGLAELGAHYARAWRTAFRIRIGASILFARLAMNNASRAAATGLIRAFPAILALGASASGKVGRRTGFAQGIAVK